METTANWLMRMGDQILGYIPSLIAGLVILLIGYVIAVILTKITRALAHRLGFDRFLARLGYRGSAGSHYLGSAVFFVVMIATILQASRALQLTFIAVGLARVIAYLPHVLAAAVAFALALFFGNWVRDRLATVGPEAPRERRMLPSLVRTGIIAVGSFMALRELQIAPDIVNSAFILIMAAVALAGALAFGVGGRDVARQIAESWYARRGASDGAEGGLGRSRVIEVTTPVEPQRA